MVEPVDVSGTNSARRTASHDLNDPDTRFNLQLATHAWKTVHAIHQQPEVGPTLNRNFPPGKTVESIVLVCDNGGRPR
jgi:hypothetical protein